MDACVVDVHELLTASLRARASLQTTVSHTASNIMEAQYQSYFID